MVITTGNIARPERSTKLEFITIKNMIRIGLYNNVIGDCRVKLSSIISVYREDKNLYFGLESGGQIIADFESNEHLLSKF